MGCAISSSRTHSPSASPARSFNVRNSSAEPSHSPSVAAGSNIDNHTAIINDNLATFSHDHLRPVLAETDKLIDEIEQARNRLGDRVNRVGKAATNLKNTLQSKITESTATSIDYSTILERLRQDFALLQSD